MDWEAVYWLIAMVIFVTMEASTVSLVSIWFAVGSLAAIVTALLGFGLGTQVVVFLLVSVLLLVFLRSVVQKYIRPRLSRTNVDSVIGATALVTTPVNNVAALGQVRIGGMEWSARSTSGQPIPEGTLVRVDRVEGVKVFVSLAEEPAIQ